MRLDLAKKRGYVNELMSEIHSLREEMVNVSEAITKEFQESSDFIQQYFQLIMITNRFRQTIQFQIVLLEHVSVQLDILSLEHLSRNVVSPGCLKELLSHIAFMLYRAPCYLHQQTKQAMAYIRQFGLAGFFITFIL